MDEIPLLALDLPLKLLVWEQDGAVNVAYTPMSEIAARYGVTGDARVSRMDAALAKLTDSVSAPSST
jgi:uncharacterized protein (DUF302 family)